MKAVGFLLLKKEKRTSASVSISISISHFPFPFPFPFLLAYCSRDLGSFLPSSFLAKLCWLLWRERKRGMEGTDPEAGCFPCPTTSPMRANYCEGRGGGGIRRLFLRSSESSATSSPLTRTSESESEVVVLCPRPRRVQLPMIPSNDNNYPFLPDFPNPKKQSAEKDGDNRDEQGLMLFCGSPPSRSSNPLVRDPQFLNQLGIQQVALPHSSAGTNSPSSSSNESFFSSRPSLGFVPTRIQGFNFSSGRGGSANARVLSAWA